MKHQLSTTVVSRIICDNCDASEITSTVRRGVTYMSVDIIPQSFIHPDKNPQAFFNLDFCSEACAEDFWSRHGLEKCEDCNGKGYVEDSGDDIEPCFCRKGWLLVEHEKETK